MGYIDLVICKHPVDSRHFLFQAPRFSYLKKGDQAVVDTARGEQTAFVIDAITCVEGSDEFNFIVTALKATTPLKKVLSKVAYMELAYKEENDEFDQD